MPALLGGFAVLAVVWLASRARSATAPPIMRKIEALGWTQKARLIWALSRDERVPPATRMIVLIPAFYLVSPIDILPDFIPFLGRLDDAAIFSLSMDLLVRFSPPGVVAEHVERLRQ